MKANQISEEWIANEYPLGFREGQKYRKEWNVLRMFQEYLNEYDGFDVEKGEHPDFILSLGDKRIGIEITEFTQQDFQIATRILEKIKGEATTTKELKAAAIRRHGVNAEKFEYEVFEGKPSVVIGFSDLTKHTQLFVEQVKKKYEKYCCDIAKFEEFYVLCNALDGIDIVNEDDAMRVVYALEEIQFEHRFHVAILYQVESTGMYGCLVHFLKKATETGR